MITVVTNFSRGDRLSAKQVAELAAEDEPWVVIRGRMDAAGLEVALSQGERGLSS